MRSRVTNCSGRRPVFARRRARNSERFRERAERAQLDQAGERVDRDLCGQPCADVVFHFLELADGQAAADVGALAGGVGVLFYQLTVLAMPGEFDIATR
jgi:hypothetical protein